MTPEQRALFFTRAQALLTDLMVAFSRHPDIYGRVDDPQSTASMILRNFRDWLDDANTTDDAQRWTANIQEVLADVQGATGENISAWPSWYALVQTVSMMAREGLTTAITLKDAANTVIRNPLKSLAVGIGAYFTFLWLTSRS